MTTSLGGSASAADAPRPTTPPPALPVELQRRREPNAPFPLLPLQQGYFIGQQDGWELSYESAHFYGDVALFNVDGDEAAETLEDALRRLAAHQPTLRARVTDDGRQYVLPVDAEGAVPPLRVHDLREATNGEVQKRLAEIREEMGANGPDPTSGPGLEIRLSLLPGDQGRLHTSMSLLVLDGWSFTVVLRELLTLAANWNAMLEPLGLDFGDYVTSVASLPETQAWAADQAWWWKRLDNAPQPPALPLRADPRTVRPKLMANREARLSADRWSALREQCAKHSVTPSAALLTEFSIVLARWAGHRRMLLNSLHLNRVPLHSDVHRVAGAFASTMLIPVELDNDRRFIELATTTQRNLSDCVAHNLITGVEVSRELARRRGTRRPVGPVVFQSSLGMNSAVGEEQPASAGPLGEVRFKDYYHQLRTPQVALEARLFELDADMMVVFSLVEELFEPAQVDSAFAEFVAAIETLADGTGWDRVVALPYEPDPAGGIRLGQLDEQAVDQDSGPLRDDLEKNIAAVWAELLEEDVVDRGCDFFASGGDSLMAVRVLALLAKQHGIRVTVHEFLQAPTVAGLASVVRTNGK